MGDPSADRQRPEGRGDAAREGQWAWLQPWRSGGDTGQSHPIRIPERRSGGDRRSASQEASRQESSRRQGGRRAHVRQPMPFGGVAPSGRICRDGQVCAHADLVDLSEGGICVLLPNPMPLKLGDRLVLTLHENFGFGSLDVDLEVRWLVETPIGLRVGGRFLDPAFKPSDTFLKTYLDTDFGGHRRSDG